MGTSKLIDSSAAFLFEVPEPNSPRIVQELQLDDAGPRKAFRPDYTANYAVPGDPVPIFASRSRAQIRSECEARSGQFPDPSGSWFCAGVEFAF
jgi:hypothetical protein